MDLFCIASMAAIGILVALFLGKRGTDDFPRDSVDNAGQIMEEIILLEMLEDEEGD